MNNISDLLNYRHHYIYNSGGLLRNMGIAQVNIKHFSMLLLNSLFNIIDYLDDNYMLENSTRTDNDFKLFISLIKNITIDDTELASQFSKEMNMFTRINVLNMASSTIQNIIQLNKIDINAVTKIPFKIISELNKYKTADELRLIEMDLKHRVKMKLSNSHKGMYPFRFSENIWIDGVENSIFFFVYFYNELVRNPFEVTINQPFEIYLRKVKCLIYSYTLMNISDLYSPSIQDNSSNSTMSQLNRFELNNNIGKQLQQKIELSKKIYQQYKAFGYISPFCIINSYQNLYKLPITINENNLILTKDMRELLISVILLSLFNLDF